jgi:basic membrane protein A and related proteins
LRCWRRWLRRGAAENNAAPGIVYAPGTKFDKSFSEGAWRGAERFKAETGIAYHEIEIANDNQRVQALSELIRHSVPSAGARHCAAM